MPCADPGSLPLDRSHETLHAIESSLPKSSFSTTFLFYRLRTLCVEHLSLLPSLSKPLVSYNHIPPSTLSQAKGPKVATIKSYGNWVLNGGVKLQARDKGVMSTRGLLNGKPVGLSGLTGPRSNTKRLRCLPLKYLYPSCITLHQITNTRTLLPVLAALPTVAFPRHILPLDPVVGFFHVNCHGGSHEARAHAVDINAMRSQFHRWVVYYVADRCLVPTIGS